MSVDRILKVLLVEDSGAMRKMERTILAKLGFTNVVEAADGIEAVELLERDDGFGLVISRKGRLQRVGILVEAVAEIVDIDALNVEDAPAMLAEAEYILAMAKVRGEVKLLVDIDRIMQGSLDLVA